MDICDRILIGNSAAIQGVKELIRHVAKSDLNVVICGESGVGKELVAQALHLSSNRRNRPFIKVNCAAIPKELLESELFGYERGAFTGADRTKKGRFELGHKGTVLLDEIGDMPLVLQSKMLQVLQDFQFSRLGAKKDVTVDCWVLAASNQDLEQAVSSGRFREDLYYRLNIISIFIPPLRERAEDIDPLIDFFAAQSAQKIENVAFEFTDSVRDYLRQYSWPGNIRELKNTVERLMLLGDWQTVQRLLLARETKWVDGLEPGIQPAPLAPDPDKKETRQEKFPPLKEVKKKAILRAEGELISEVLTETGWNRKRAAEILQISYKALLYKIKQLNLRPED
ncbi:MAG: sigma-54-dependent Fis family transcriptional regulator [Desulfobacterales bacterium]|nr:MAG: sigma-54-dependent Fis family transcriptional regulator [Desulfobacterales bacterium]